MATAPDQTASYAAGREESRDRSPRFSGDSLLRQYGFVIAARPSGGPAVWRRVRDGRLCSDFEAQQIAQRERAEQLARLEARGS